MHAQEAKVQSGQQRPLHHLIHFGRTIVTQKKIMPPTITRNQFWPKLRIRPRKFDVLSARRSIVRMVAAPVAVLPHPLGVSAWMMMKTMKMLNMLNTLEPQVISLLIPFSFCLIDYLLIPMFFLSYFN
jgi:hypothetical protein